MSFMSLRISKGSLGMVAKAFFVVLMVSLVFLKFLLVFLGFLRAFRVSFGSLVRLPKGFAL